MTVFNGKMNYFDWAIFNSFLYVYQRVILMKPRLKKNMFPIEILHVHVSVATNWDPILEKAVWVTLGPSKSRDFGAFEEKLHRAYHSSPVIDEAATGSEVFCI
jgi:hypothetical protein